MEWAQIHFKSPESTILQTKDQWVGFLGGSLASQVSVASGQKKNVTSLSNIGATSGISPEELPIISLMKTESD